MYRFFIASLLVATANAAIGCSFSADCSGATCMSELADCNYQFDLTSYTDSGIPCGDVYGDVITCPVGGTEIAGNFKDFPLLALIELKEEISTIVPIGANNLDELTNPANLPGAFLVTHPGQTINATFIDEGACFRNTMGMITWDADLVPGKTVDMYSAADRETVLEGGKMSIFFPNVDDFVCQLGKDLVICPDGDEFFCTSTTPHLPLGATVRLKHPEWSDYVFPVNTYVSLFMVPDGFDRGLEKGGTGFSEKSGMIHFALDTLNKADENNVGSPITSISRVADFDVDVSGVNYDFSDFVLYIFEDKDNNDYQDVVVLLDTFIPKGSCGGILNDCGDICCPEVCGVCGGCDVDCFALSTVNGVQCCPGAIRESENFCDMEDEEACIVEDAPLCDVGNCDL